MAKKPKGRNIRENQFWFRQSPFHWFIVAQGLWRSAEDLLAVDLPRFLEREKIHEELQKEAWARMASGETSVQLSRDQRLEIPNFQAADMLLGFAIENLLKGLMIAKDPSLVAPPTIEARLSQKLTKHHDLERFYRVASVNGNPDGELLKQLTVAIYWSGRYPVPTDAKGIPEFFEMTTGPLTAQGLYTALEQRYDRIRSVLASLSDELKGLMHSWRPPEAT